MPKPRNRKPVAIPSLPPVARVAGAPHGELGNFAAISTQQQAQHAARVADDQEFTWWAEDVERFRAERAKKSISLNEATRRAERDQLDAERKARDAERQALGLEVDPISRPDDGLSANERSIAQQTAEEEAAKNRPDPLLREAAAILADALDLLSESRTLTAQVLPVTRQPTVWAE